MSLSKGNRIWSVVEAKCAKPCVCHLLMNVIGPFHHRDVFFLTILMRLVLRR